MFFLNKVYQTELNLNSNFLPKINHSNSILFSKLVKTVKKWASSLVNVHFRGRIIFEKN